MNNYKSTRHAKFLLNYHFIWIHKYRKHILDNPKIKQLTLNTINELADTHKFEVLATAGNVS
uniref:transposase n=1 Tax=Halanaerobium saccharolyticum TaxID=43595 RepID=UPI001F2BF636|nr:transposase [Halanaerobium saccharolyticum]